MGPTACPLFIFRRAGSSHKWNPVNMPLPPLSRNELVCRFGRAGKIHVHLLCELCGVSREVTLPPEPSRSIREQLQKVPLEN
jgi:hypothetical protein